MKDVTLNRPERIRLHALNPVSGRAPAVATPQRSGGCVTAKPAVSWRSIGGKAVPHVLTGTAAVVVDEVAAVVRMASATYADATHAYPTEI